VKCQRLRDGILLLLDFDPREGQTSSCQLAYLIFGKKSDKFLTKLGHGAFLPVHVDPGGEDSVILV
jgi:hypothetical protein